MNNGLDNLFIDFGSQIINYLPSLLAGIILLLVGWLIGWIAKRIVIQILVILRFERIFIRLKWRKALSKADIRYAMFNLIGNIVFFIVFLIFLNSALAAMQLNVLSTLIQQGVLFIPKLIIALIILGVGWIIAGRVSHSVYNALLKEDVPYYSIIARFVKFVSLLFFASMAIVEIDIASQVVVIGFTTIMITFGIISIVLIYRGSKPISDLLKTAQKEDRN